MPKTLNVIISTLVVVSLVALFFWLLLPTGEAKLMEEVYALLESYYVNPNAITSELLEKDSVDEMLQALNDPYTYHISAENWTEWHSYFEGDFFTGIGVKLCQSELDGENVTAVLGIVPHSPADKAEIEPGDLILEIDGNSTVNVNATTAALELRGDAGTNVTLSVQHQGGQPELKNITRQQIDISTWWQGLVDGNIAYIDIDYFSDATDDKLNFTLYDLQDDDVAGIILDLRDNPGGVLWEQQQDHSGGAAGVAGQFLEENRTILWLDDGRGNEEEIVAGSGGLATDWPLAVLVNGDTASAAEMVAGALQDSDDPGYSRVCLIGTNTYGKGCMQYIIELSDGSAVSITHAYWYTPNRFENGTYLTEEHGLSPDPDFQVEDNILTAEDEQLEAAIDYIAGL
jgi:carboxyl-terminal processing protease